MLDAGRRDLGFAGADWVAELDAELVEILDTASTTSPSWPPPRERARRRRAAHASPDYRLGVQPPDSGVDADPEHRRTLCAAGATEVLPPEDADCIVDNTATGSTLRANRLQIVDTLMTSSTRLYASNAALEDPSKRDRIEALAWCSGRSWTPVSGSCRVQRRRREARRGVAPVAGHAPAHGLQSARRQRLGRQVGGAQGRSGGTHSRPQERRRHGWWSVASTKSCPEENVMSAPQPSPAPWLAAPAYAVPRATLRPCRSDSMATKARRPRRGWPVRWRTSRPRPSGPISTKTESRLATRFGLRPRPGHGHGRGRRCPPADVSELLVGGPRTGLARAHVRHDSALRRMGPGPGGVGALGHPAVSHRSCLGGGERDHRHHRRGHPQ